MEETKILTWENKKEAVRILKKGGIVAFPTDTVYGLAVISSRPEPSQISLLPLCAEVWAWLLNTLK